MMKELLQFQFPLSKRRIVKFLALSLLRSFVPCPLEPQVVCQKVGVASTRRDKRREIVGYVIP